MRRPRGRPRRYHVSGPAWERLRILPEELEEVSGEEGDWAALLRLLRKKTRDTYTHRFIDRVEGHRGGSIPL